MTGRNREEGISGEETAIKTLKKHGYRIVERNYRSRLGEIDVIAEEGGCLVFVEVKKRNNVLFGDALCSIDGTKKRHLVRSALFYLKTHDCAGKGIRFDVVGIDGERIKLVKNAFLVEEYE